MSQINIKPTMSKKKRARESDTDGDTSVEYTDATNDSELANDDTSDEDIFAVYDSFADYDSDSDKYLDLMQKQSMDMMTIY